MIDRYNRNECGHFVAFLKITYRGADTLYDWRILHVSHDYIAAQEAYHCEQPDRRQSALFFGFRNKDGTVSVHDMHANDMCIVIQRENCLCGALLGLPSAVEAAIDEMNAAEPYTPKKEG